MMHEIFEKIYQTINKNTRMIQHHIGLGGKSHPPVDNVNAGFMTPNQLDELNSIFGPRQSVQGTDDNPLRIEKLPSGFYNVYKAIDHPLSNGTPTYWTSAVSIKVSGDGSKDILLFDIGNNRLFYETSGTDGVGKGWQRIMSGKTLFSGIAKMGDVITLTDDITRYANVGVTMTTNDKVVGTASRQFAVGTSVVISASQFINSHLYHFQIMVTALTEKTVKVIDTVEVLPDGSIVATDHCYLHKIFAYNY